MKLYRSASGVCLTVLVAALAACGGGGGGDAAAPDVPTSTSLTVTGTAATGLAIAGATVTGKCKVGTGTATTLANGSFTLTVTEGQLPCVLQVTNPADGTKLHTLVSGSGSTAVANITPLTEMTTARVLGGEPNVFFAAFDAAAATQKVTTANITAAQTAIGLVFAGTIDTTGIANFITTPLVAATQGSPTSGDAQDKLLDALKLKLTTAQLGTVTTALAGNQTADAIKQTVISLTTVPTTPPVANAGAAQSVVAGATITLDASTSSAAAGKTLTYAWTLASKPVGSAATLTAPTTAKPTFVADVAGAYVASVIVNDGTTASSAAAVTVTASVANAAPVANAGLAQNVVAGSLVTLDGSASSDANGDTLTYAWTLTSKPAGSTAALSSATSAKPTLTADAAGTYVATLTVNDGKVNSAATTVIVTAQLPKPMVSYGELHACGVNDLGGVKCWGWNVDGLLGNGTNVTSATPVPVTGISTAITVAAALNHSCAVLADRTVKCWGLNPFGGLGDATKTQAYSPVKVSGLSNVKMVATGLWHSCAVTQSGDVLCWGANIDGQLGDTNITTESLIPVLVKGVSGAKAVAAGQWHTCALISDGTVKCWGKWFTGLKGTTQVQSYTPIAIPGIVSATEISLGNTHSCVLLASGQVQCWGDNDYGQLGVSPIPPFNSQNPVLATGVSSAVAVSAGANGTCALLRNGTVQCWGQGAVGQYGGSGSQGDSFIPVTVTGITDGTFISLSQSNSNKVCVAIQAGGVRCWRGTGAWEDLALK